MSALLLLFVQNPQIALMTPQGLKHGYEPFWASHWWLADSGHTRRVITAQEYRDRVLRSDDEALKLRCGERGMEPCATREDTIRQLLAILDDLPRPDHLDVATWAELVEECRYLNLNAAGSEAELRERIRASGPGPLVTEEAGEDEADVVDTSSADEPPAEDAPPAPSDAPLPEPADEVPAPVEPAQPAASLPPFDAAQLVQLKAHLEADNYNGVWSVGTNLTSSRPADKSKAAVYAWARALIQELEG